MSGVYIKGMEMPKDCYDCPLIVEEERFSVCIPLARVLDDESIRQKDCPLIPVPDHGRLIDKDALEQDISDSVVFSGRENNPEIYGANKIINRIHLAPTIIPADKGDGE